MNQGSLSLKNRFRLSKLPRPSQNRLLKEFETSAEEENWDVYPIAEIEREVEGAAL